MDNSEQILEDLKLALKVFKIMYQNIDNFIENEDINSDRNKKIQTMKEQLQRIISKTKLEIAIMIDMLDEKQKNKVIN